MSPDRMVYFSNFMIGWEFIEFRLEISANTLVTAKYMFTFYVVDKAW